MLRLLFVFLLLISAKAYSQEESLETNDTISKIEQKILKLGLGRYMEQGHPEIITNLPGWEGDTLALYRYSVHDKINGTLKATVILYDANVHRLANWIYFSLADCGKNISDNNIDKVIKNIRGASGFQFPVRGIVYEDIYSKPCGCITYDDCKDGKGCKNCIKDTIQESYIFFDGITVKHNTIQLTICAYDTMPVRATDEQMEQLLKMTVTDIKTVQNYARIAATDYKTYLRFMRFRFKQDLGSVIYSNLTYLPEIRTAYKKAMHSKRNNLVSAWVLANIKS